MKQLGPEGAQGTESRTYAGEFFRYSPAAHSAIATIFATYLSLVTACVPKGHSIAIVPLDNWITE